MFGPKTALAAKVKTANIEVRIAIIEAKKGVAPSQARTALVDDTVIGTEIATNGAEIKEMVIEIAAKEERVFNAWRRDPKRSRGLRLRVQKDTNIQKLLIPQQRDLVFRM